MENIKIFQGLSKESLKRVELALKKRIYIAGDTIFEEGDRGKEFYIIIKGNVEILKSGVKIEELGEKEIFGEMAVIDDLERSATVKAGTDIEVYVMSYEEFQQLKKEDIEAYTQIIINISKELSARLREINDKIQRIWKWYISAN